MDSLTLTSEPLAPESPDLGLPALASSPETLDSPEALSGDALALDEELTLPNPWDLSLPGLPIRDGDWVILQMMDGKKLTVQAGKSPRGTHYGEMDLKQLVGMQYGTVARTRQGVPIFLMRPTLQDHIMVLKRITQIIYPKDIGTILMKLGIGPGSRVLECGTGSGALTMALAWMVGPTGKIYSYEREMPHHERARYNLTRVGLIDRVELKHRDMAGAQFDERGVEAAFLDVREPVDLLPQITASLAPGGILGILVPTVNQITDVLLQLETAPYLDTEVMETFFRKYKVNAHRLRPEDRMIGHTGFLIFTRRIIPVADFVAPVRKKKGDAAAEDVALEVGAEPGDLEGGLGGI